MKRAWWDFGRDKIIVFCEGEHPNRGIFEQPLDRGNREGEDDLVVIQGKNHRWGYKHCKDKKGAWIIKPKFYEAYPFYDGLAKVGELSYGPVLTKYGYINKKGEYVIEPKFTKADIFSEGIACVGDGHSEFCIDKSGRHLFNVRIGIIGRFHCGLAIMKEYTCTGRHLWGYLDTKGEWVIEPIFDNVTDFRKDGGFAEGSASVEINGKLGFLIIKTKIRR